MLLAVFCVQVFLSHQPLSFATTVLLACALCIHSILEGIALGAQQSMKSTQDIMLAIAAHKGLAAYALGASIVESKVSSVCLRLYLSSDGDLLPGLLSPRLLCCLKSAATVGCQLGASWVP